MSTKLDRLEFSEKNFAFTESFITQTREKWDSQVLSAPDFWMVWKCHGILCVHLYFFLFRGNVRKGYLDDSDLSHFYWITAMLKFLLNNYEAYWEQHFEGHPTVEDLMGMDQDSANSFIKTFLNVMKQKSKRWKLSLAKKIPPRTSKNIALK